MFERQILNEGGLVTTQGTDEEERKWLLQHKCVSAGQNMYHYRSRYK